MTAFQSFRRPILKNLRLRYTFHWKKQTRHGTPFSISALHSRSKVDHSNLVEVLRNPDSGS
jgi:hypothetical protein